MVISKLPQCSVSTRREFSAKKGSLALSQNMKRLYWSYSPKPQLRPIVKRLRVKKLIQILNKRLIAIEKTGNQRKKTATRVQVAQL